MKGFLSGIVVGAVVSTLALLALGRLAPLTDLSLPAPEAGAVAVPAGSEFNQERPDTTPVLPGTDARPGSNEPPAVGEPDAATESLPETSPLTTPVTAPLAEAGMTAPAAPGAPPQIEPGVDTAIMPDSVVAQPDAPAVDAAPAATAAVEAPDTAPAPAIMADPQTPAAAPQVQPGTDVAMATEAPVAQPAAPTADIVPQPDASVAAPETATAPAVMADPAMPSETGLSQPGAPETGATAAAPEAPSAPAAMAEPVTPSDTPPAALPGTPQGLRLPTAEIEDMTPGITTDRLPRIGAESDAVPEVEIVGAESALSRNAVYFEAAPGIPVMAVILVDIGPMRPDPAMLAEFPLPLTVALDPTAPDAAALMQSYRDAGLEVVILTQVADDAAPADVAVAFDNFFAAVPQAVAVLDLPEALLQASRPRAAQVVEILTGTGHGLITYDKGLNMALQIASRSGVPSATVFRNIDDGSHDVAAMKRLLDQGAFRAGQDGAVILIAEARPETLAALAEWSLGSRAATVTFAPVSAVLEP